MDQELWNKITEDYETAKKCFENPNGTENRQRNEDLGYYHLWCAYHAATTSEERDPLLYARILMMMNRHAHHLNGCRRFHTLIAPAMAAYTEAIHSGVPVSQKEFTPVEREYKSLRYVLKKTDNSPEETVKASSLIEGLVDVGDFHLRNSSVISFDLRAEYALLRLEDDGVRITLEFTGLVSVKVNTDPAFDMIDDFYCYPMFHNPEFIYFDIGSYGIACRRIRVTDVTREEEDVAAAV